MPSAQPAPHQGQFLVCQRASLADSEVRRLCQQIIESQQRETVEMENMLAR